MATDGTKNKWQENYIVLIKKLSNYDVFDQLIYDAQGDDWDGAFTDQGEWKFHTLRAEVEERLADWFAEDSNEASE